MPRKLAQLEVREQCRDLVARERPVVPFAIGRSAGQPADAVGVGIGRKHQIRLLLARDPLPAIHALGNLGIGRLRDVRKLAVRRRLLRHGNGPKALRFESFTRTEPAAAVQRREHHAKLVELWRRNQALLPAQLDVGPVRSFIQEVNLPASHGIDPRQLLDDADLIDVLAHELIFGRHGLRAAFVVKLAAVVVGRVVARGHVQAAVGL